MDEEKKDVEVFDINTGSEIPKEEQPIQLDKEETGPQITSIEPITEEDLKRDDIPEEVKKMIAGNRQINPLRYEPAYKIISDTILTVFEEKVLKKMEEGYLPVGGVAITTVNDVTRYHQVVAK